MGKVLSDLCFPVHCDKSSQCLDGREDNKEENKVPKSENPVEESQENKSNDSFYLISECEGNIPFNHRHK